MATAPLITRTPKASTENVRFTDGMIVTAEDLGAATRYPLALMQVLVRAYFGCGVVCGLSLRQDSRTDARVDRTDNCRPENASYTAEIASGVALDCGGYPLEVCGPVRIDLTPDPCGRPGPLAGDETRTLHIAIRRAQQAGSAGQQKGCACECGEGSCGDGESQCSRVRDHVEIGVFEELPEDSCRRSAKEPENGKEGCSKPEEKQGGRIDEGRNEDKSICDCLTECEHCDCCGENWVALGTVTIDKWGIVERGVAHDTRRYVKPIECICARPAKTAPPIEPKEQQTIEVYSAKLNEYRYEQEARITELRQRTEVAEKQALELQARFDERIRVQAEQLQGRIAQIEAQIREVPITKNAPTRRAQGEGAAGSEEKK